MTLVIHEFSSFHLSCDLFQLLLDGLTQNVEQIDNKWQWVKYSLILPLANHKLSEMSQQPFLSSSEINVLSLRLWRHIQKHKVVYLQCEPSASVSDDLLHESFPDLKQVIFVP